MFETEKFISKRLTAGNPIMKVHLFALKMFGYMIFDDQKNFRHDYARGVILTVSFILFNITQVRANVELSHFENFE